MVGCWKKMERIEGLGEILEAEAIGTGESRTRRNPSLGSFAEVGKSGARFSTGKSMSSVVWDILSWWVFEKPKWRCCTVFTSTLFKCRGVMDHLEPEVVGSCMMTEVTGSRCNCLRRGRRIRRGPRSILQRIRKFLTSESRLQGEKQL